VRDRECVLEQHAW